MSHHDNGKDVYLPEPATLTKKQPLTETEMLFEFKLDSGRELGHMPGQFAELSIPGIGEAPLSISSSPTYKEGFQMGVRKVGNVTNAMHALEPGAKVGIRGPFGKPFPVDDKMKGRDILFIAGGIGLVPLRSAIDYVLDNRDDYGKVTILSGTKTPMERLFGDELDKWGQRDDVELTETVDDTCDQPWNGCVGVVTTLFPECEICTEKVEVIICGPPVMYKFCILGLHEKGVKDENIWVSLERRMKCGVGKCGHCQINGLYCCQDGPVFNFAEIADVPEVFK